MKRNGSSTNHFETIKSQPFICGVIKVEIKKRSMDSREQVHASKRPMKIKRRALRDVSSSCTTWGNPSAPSLIKRTQLNGNNSHPIV